MLINLPRMWRESRPISDTYFIRLINTAASFDTCKEDHKRCNKGMHFWGKGAQWLSG